MTREAVEKQLLAHKAAFHARSADDLAACHAPDGTFESPAHGLVRGRDAIRDVYRYWYSAFPDFLLTWDEAIVEENRAATFWSFRGTAAGPFFGEVREGTVLEMIGASEYTFSPEGIASIRHVFDFSGALVKAGVLRVKPA